MIQASIKACYSDYSLIDVGSHKNSLIVNQFNPMNWHGQLINDWMRNHRRTKTPLAQATRSTLVLMHGATNRAGYELYSFIEFVFESLHSSLLFRKLKESIFGASWKHILEEEASKIFIRRSCPHFRLSGERIIKQLGPVPPYERRT